MTQQVGAELLEIEKEELARMTSDEPVSRSETSRSTSVNRVCTSKFRFLASVA